jgi:hypothetical protein
MFVIQFKQNKSISKLLRHFDFPELKTLLVSPSDTQAGRETPFFKRFSESTGYLKPFFGEFFSVAFSHI